MRILTWNINSVRLRINLVARFIKAVRPEIRIIGVQTADSDAWGEDGDGFPSVHTTAAFAMAQLATASAFDFATSDPYLGPPRMSMSLRGPANRDFFLAGW